MGCVWDKSGPGPWILIKGSGGYPGSHDLMGGRWVVTEADIERLVLRSEAKRLEKLRLELWRGYWAVARFALETGASIENVISCALSGNFAGRRC